MSSTKHIGRAIDYASRRRGLSRKELAALADLAPANITRIISGDQWMSARTLEAIADAVGMPPSELFRIAEQGVPYQAVVKEDQRKRALKLLIDALSDDQLDATFRHLSDENAQPEGEDAHPSAPGRSKRIRRG